LPPERSIRDTPLFWGLQAINEEGNPRPLVTRAMLMLLEKNQRREKYKKQYIKFR